MFLGFIPVYTVHFSDPRSARISNRFTAASSTAHRMSVIHAKTAIIVRENTRFVPHIAQMLISFRQRSLFFFRFPMDFIPEAQHILEILFRLWNVKLAVLMSYIPEIALRGEIHFTVHYFKILSETIFVKNSVNVSAALYMKLFLLEHLRFNAESTRSMPL